MCITNNVVVRRNEWFATQTKMNMYSLNVGQNSTRAVGHKLTVANTRVRTINKKGAPSVCNISNNKRALRLIASAFSMARKDSGIGELALRLSMRSSRHKSVSGSDFANREQVSSKVRRLRRLFVYLIDRARTFSKFIKRHRFVLLDDR